MAGVFEKVVERLVNTPFEFEPNTLKFKQLDSASLAKSLDLKERGDQRGADDLPASDSETFDEVENEIVARISKQRDEDYDRLLADLDASAERSRALDFQGAVTEIRRAIAEAKADFVAYVHTGQDRLSIKRRGVLEATEAYEHFRETARLKRPAHFPKSKYLHVAIVAVVWLIETVLNSTFLASGHEFGLIGGLGVAAAVSIINVVVGYFIGAALVPYLLHVASIKRLFSAVGLIVYLVFVVASNTAFAHYRDALSGTDPIGASALVMEKIFNDPSGFADFTSIVMLLLGVVFCGIGIVDGFKSDDPYPGYGRTSKKLERAEEDYTTTKDELVQDLEEVRDEQVDSMTIASTRLGQQKRQFHDIEDFRAQYLSRYEQHMRHLQQAANELLRIYREANAASRESECPNHFADDWAMEWTAPPEPSATETGNIKKTVGLADEGIKLLSGGIESVNEWYADALKDYQRIDHMVAGELDNGAAISTQR